MSIQELFKKKNTTILQGKTLEEVGSEIESEEFLKEEIVDRERFIPDVDFSDPSKFVHYGSAEKYYTDAISRIYNQFPFDGSLTEKQQFFNSSSYLDKFIFDKWYPRTNGYVKFSPNGWGTQVTSSANGFGEPTTQEYIRIKGVMSTGSNRVGANVYDESKYRTANLRMGGDYGNTVEFWLKKGVPDASKTSKEVLFDLWNGKTVTHAAGSNYGRLLIYIDGTVSDPTSCFKVTYVSGTVNVCTDQVIGAADSTVDTGSVCSETWNHYAFSFINNSSNLSVKLYVNGILNDTVSCTNGAINEVTGALLANIGAMRTKNTPTESPASDNGYGKLSGSLDEFRFWKKARTDKEIYENWYSQLGVMGAGGTNKEDYNVHLGVYYKFNEGIVGNSGIDNKVLDYSGRVSDGIFYGYTSSSRSTGSAMVDSGILEEEWKDPIIYSTHPEVSALYNIKQASGSAYDHEINTSIFQSFPAWIVDEDRNNDDSAGNLYNLSQIIGSYFDTLHSQIEYLPKIKETRYFTGSFQKPLPFANRLLEGMGFNTSEIFSEADERAQFLDTDNSALVFDRKLTETKNLIYTNIYNNLSYILKSKGTEKSLRNFIRCFGIDDDLLKVNFYGNNATYDLKTNYKYVSTKTNVVDFNDPARFGATIYHFSKSSDIDTTSYLLTNNSAISGSSMTFEGEFIFPLKHQQDSPVFFDTPFITCSLFGCHTAKITNDADTSWASSDVANFYVMALKEKEESKNVKFILTGSSGGFFPLLTSSFFNDVYENQKWNFSVRIKSHKYPLVNFVTSSMYDTYDIVFTGYNSIGDQLLNSFNVSSSISFNQAQSFLTNPKRSFVGAHRTNFTGSLISYSDVKASSFRVWMSYLTDEEILRHSYDSTNYGAERVLENDSFRISSLNKIEIPKIETLALHWDFSTLTGSDASGQFVVEDASSGSNTLDNRYTWLGPITKIQNTARGDLFPISNNNVVDSEYLYNAKQKLPEVIDSSNMIEILERDDITFTKDTRPVEYFAMIEKSMYQVISEDMLNMFASIKDFNNLIGNPVNRYRQEYKELKYLKSLYFEKVQNTPDIETFIEFYKWIDNSISKMLQQLLPLSSNVREGVQEVLESHILERNKYWYKYPTLEMKADVPEGGTKGINELNYNWKLGSAPIPTSQKNHCLYWKERALRTETPLSTSNNFANNDRDKIHSSSYTELQRTFTKPYSFKLDENSDIHGGTNFPRKKKINFIIDCLKKGLNSTTNQVSVSASSIQQWVDCNDDNELVYKTKLLSAKVDNIYEGTSKDYSSGENEILLPFSIATSSANDGYIKTVSNNFMTGVNFVNLHVDTYGSDKDVPMQGPFAEKYVGGYQYRHYHYNGSVTSSEINRGEGYRITFDTNNKVFYVKDADSAVGTLRAPKVKYYREELAKRPINVKNISNANYFNDYEYVQTSGRKYNNKALIASGGFAPVTSSSPFLDGFLDYQKIDRGNNKQIFVERFSAPGGPETAGDSNGGVGLDVDAAEYSIYNGMNYRNYIVRDVLNILARRRMGEFGYDSEVGTGVIATSYQASASYHKVHFNSLEKMEYSCADSDWFVQVGKDCYATGTMYDNWFIQHPIPQDDAAYYWIQSSTFVSGSSTD